MIVVVVFLLVKNIFGFGKTLTEEQACRDSVNAQASQHLLRGLDITAKIKCPTLYTTIQEQDEERIKAALAEQMRSCWSKFWEGKKNLFSESDVFCAICSVTDFKTDKPVKGFSKYLMDTIIPGKDISYADYLQGYSTKKTEEIKNRLTVEQLKSLEDETLDTKNKYAVVFVYARGEDVIEDYVRHLAFRSTSGQVSGVVSGTMGVAAGVTTAAALIFYTSTPVGWVAAGATAAAIAAYAGTEFLTSYFREQDIQWMSMVVLREYSKEGMDSIQCRTLPVASDKVAENENT